MSEIKAPRAPRRRQTEVDKARQEKNEWKARALRAEAERRELRQAGREVVAAVNKTDYPYAVHPAILRLEAVLDGD